MGGMVRRLSHGGSAMESERKLAAANSTARLLAVRRRWWFVAQWADAEPPDDGGLGEVLNATAIGGVTRKEGPLDELEVAGAGPEAWRDMTLGTLKLVKFKGHKVRRCAELLYIPCYLKYCGIQGKEVNCTLISMVLAGQDATSIDNDGPNLN